MGDRHTSAHLPLDIGQPLWSKFFMVAPLVLVGTRDMAGVIDFAPKHMAMPLGWENYFAFVCTPRHRTYQNIQAIGEFSVNFPRPEQVLMAGLAATPRSQDCDKLVLSVLPTVAGQKIRAPLLANGYLCLECALEQVLDGFGENSLIIGKIVAAQADPIVLRDERDDAEILQNAPLLAYLPPNRYCPIEQSFSFPFPASTTR